MIFEERNDQGSQSDRVEHAGRMVLVLDLKGEEGLRTSEIPDLAAKLETALPGIFPQSDDMYAHMCGTGEAQHAFREEIERGTTVVHLLEHVILHLLGRSNGRCGGFSGQRSVDQERGIKNHYYIVTDYTDKLQAVVAAELAFHLVSAWMSNRTVRLDADAIAKSVSYRIEGMLAPDGRSDAD